MAQIEGHALEHDSSNASMLGPWTRARFTHVNKLTVIYTYMGTSYADIILQMTDVLVWQGSAASSVAANNLVFDAVGDRWVTFILPNAGAYTGRVFVIKEKDYKALYTNIDIIPIDYIETQQWRRFQIRVIPVPGLILSPTGGVAGSSNIDINLYMIALFTGENPSSDPSAPSVGEAYGDDHAGGTVLAYPGGSTQQTYTNKLFGLGLSHDRLCKNPVGGVLAISTALNLYSINPMDETGTVTNIMSTLPSLITGTPTRRYTEAIAGDGTTAWILFSEIDTVNHHYAQVVLSTTNLSTYTTLRTIWNGNDTPTTLAIGVGEGGSTLIAANYGTVPASYPDTTTTVIDPFNWSVARATAASIALAKDNTTGSQSGKFFYNLGIYQQGFNHNTDLWYGLVSPTITGSQAYSYDGGYPLVRFGGGPKSPCIIDVPKGQVGFGTVGTVFYGLSTLIDTAGGIDTTYDFSNAIDDKSNGLYAIDTATGNLVHRAGAAGTSWTTAYTAFTAAFDIVPAMLWSTVNLGQFVVVYGSSNALTIARYNPSTGIKTVINLISWTFLDGYQGSSSTSGSFYGNYFLSATERT